VKPSLALSVLCLLCQALPLNGQDHVSPAWDLPLGDSCAWNENEWGNQVWPRPLVDLSDDFSAAVEPRVAWRDVPESGAVQAARPGWAAGLVYRKHAQPRQNAWNRWQLDLQLSHFRIGGATAELWDEAWSTGGAAGAGLARVPDGQAVHIFRFWGSVRCRLGPSSEISLGMHPHHWGRGWRSVWLDRMASPLPNLRYHVDGGRVRYTHLLGLTSTWDHGNIPLTDPNQPLPDPGRYKSRQIGWMAAHLVEVDLGRGFHGELFGAIKWLHADAAHARRFEWTYAVPFVAFRPSEYMLGSADNALVGMSGGWSSPNRPFEIAVSGLFDEFVWREISSRDNWWANKYALQLTLRGGSPDGQWRWLAESVAVRPFTYGHAGPGTAWIHGNAPLAHPAGANFIEHRLHIGWRSPNHKWHARAGGFHRRQGIDGVASYAFDAPETTTGADPRVGYGARPADYGIGWLNTGLGAVDNATLATGMHVWTTLERDIAKVRGHRWFLRAISAPQGSWRLEAGVTAGRVWGERIW